MRLKGKVKSVSGNAILIECFEINKKDKGTGLASWLFTPKNVPMDAKGKIARIIIR